MSSGTPLKLLNEVESHLPEELKSGQACQACHDSHARCDLGRPCSRCIKRQTMTTCADMAIKSRARKYPSSQEPPRDPSSACSSAKRRRRQDPATGIFHPLLAGGRAAAGSSCANVNAHEREIFTICAVSARILSTSAPLRKRWNLSCLGSSSGPEDTNLLHWILPEHGEAVVRFVLRAKAALSSDSRAHDDQHEKDAGSLRTQMLVIDEDSVGDVLWCTLTVLAPAGRALSGWAPTSQSGLRPILLEAKFEAPASTKLAERPAGAGAARWASFVAAQREGYEGVFTFDRLNSTFAFGEIAGHVKRCRTSFVGPHYELSHSPTDPSLHNTLRNVYRSADTKKREGLLSGWGDALLDRVASCVTWATRIGHTFVPDVADVALATRGTVQIHVCMRAPRMLGSLSTPWFLLDSFPFDLCDGPVPVQSTRSSRPGEDQSIFLPMRRSCWAPGTLMRNLHLRAIVPPRVATECLAPFRLWHMHYVCHHVPDANGVVLNSLTGIYVNNLALPEPGEDLRKHIYEMVMVKNE